MNICPDCGFANCPAKAFLDTKPEWVGDAGSWYTEMCEPVCEKAAKTLGSRYAEIWRLAQECVDTKYGSADNAIATDELEKFLKTNEKYND